MWNGVFTVTNRYQYVIGDAGPIIHLDELSCLDLLADFPSVHVPQRVWTEIIAVRPTLAHSIPSNVNLMEVAGVPSAELATLVHAMDLHGGEIAALKLAEQKGCDLLLCDDSAARLAAESRGIEVRGTIGLVVRAIRRKMRSTEQVLSILASIPTQSTLYIAKSLLDEVVESVSRR